MNLKIFFCENNEIKINEKQLLFLWFYIFSARVMFFRIVKLQLHFIRGWGAPI